MNPSKQSSAIKRWLKSLHRIGTALLYIALIGVAWLVMYESETSWFQSHVIVPYAASLHYEVGSGPSEAIRFPTHGPFDKRMGYIQLPQFTERLQKLDFFVEKQIRFSPSLMKFSSMGYSPPYREKSRTGLHLLDTRGEPVYAFQYPIRAYSSFEQIPQVVVDSLLFIENRSLLNPDQPYLNPAVDWPRFGRAVLAQIGQIINDDLDAPGGSTLATQLEKYRHSPDGRTVSAGEKLRQMVSASVRTYHQGIDTLPMRYQLVVDYLNTVPLSAAPVYGEVHGIGDGLWVWFGADFQLNNRVLNETPGTGQQLEAQGLAFRQMLSLIIANRRPSFYLGSASGRRELADLTDSHLRVLDEAGVISTRLKQAALNAVLQFRDMATQSALPVVGTDKGSRSIRSRLANLLDIPLYDLDRLDLEASSTIDVNLQRSVSTFLRSLKEPDAAREAGLLGERLLSADKVRHVDYSFNLYERTPGANRLRVQTDTTDQLLDINEGSKLELGSSAKLRVLATYLEVVAELHQRYAVLTASELGKVAVDQHDTLTHWAIDYLQLNGDHSLTGMLEAALNRRYSANQYEAFFTGGGLHRFSNFRREDNGRSPTIRQALQESINLPFIRLMRDLVRHTMYSVPGSTAKLLEDNSDPRRDEYLARFADREGKVFLRRFWQKYRGLAAGEIQATLLDDLRPSESGLAVVYRHLNPDADVESFAEFMRRQFPDKILREDHIARLYRQYEPGSFDLPNQGYIARIHPLELWIAGYLKAKPGASFDETVAASSEERQLVYRWLFRTRFKNAQDRRIYTLLEVEAFLDIHQRWERLGYPFGHLVPSLATAIGSSGDRPAALAELMGIIVNDGIRLPSIRIDHLRFGIDTPYETIFARRSYAGERVMLPEIARVLRSALSDVVEGGTARRLAAAFKLPDGKLIPVGGKTGTGDNRIFLVNTGGQKRVTGILNRTAVFVFYLGDRHFGTLTAYVAGSEAADYRFTSALPVQILKSMEPLLLPYLGEQQTGLAGN